jgi:hypothetical protein
MAPRNGDRTVPQDGSPNKDIGATLDKQATRLVVPSLNGVLDISTGRGNGAVEP